MLFESRTDGEVQVSIEEAGMRSSLICPTSINGVSKNALNIYLGVISRIEPSLNGCFINYGEKHDGFLPFQEIAPIYFCKETKFPDTQINKVLKIGQEFIVQVQQSQEAAHDVPLTTFVTLFGRYLVLFPRHDKCLQDQVPDLHQQALQKHLTLRSDVPFRLRNAGFNCRLDQAQYDLRYLRQLWSAIEGAAKSSPGPFLIYQDDSIIIRTIRDHFQEDIEEILVDNEDTYAQLSQYMQHVMPEMASRVRHVNSGQSTSFAARKEMPGKNGETLLARLRNLFAR